MSVKATLSYYDKDTNFTSVVGADPNDYWIDTGYETKVVNPAHVTMADYFINELRDAILAYNPNFPPDRALALAKINVTLNDLGYQSLMTFANEGMK